MGIIKPFMDFLDELDKFKGCTMAICDYATTSSNYIDDMSEKANIKRVDTKTWEFSNFDSLELLYTEYYELNSSINSSVYKVQNWINQNCDAETKKKSQLLSSTTGSYGKSYI
jgi:hypothetical protein